MCLCHLHDRATIMDYLVSCKVNCKVYNSGRDIVAKIKLLHLFYLISGKLEHFCDGVTGLVEV